MRIVNVVQRYAPAIGGSETWCQEVCRQLAKWGHDVSVLTLDITEEEQFWREAPPDRRTLTLGPLDFDEGVRIRRFRRSIPVHSVYHALYRGLLDRGLGIYFYGPHSLEMYLKLAAHVRLADAVLLHTLPYPHNAVAWSVAKLLRKPAFLVPHFHPGHPFYERWHHYWLMRRCQGVFAVSEFEAEALVRKGISRSRVVVTGNGVHEKSYQLDDAGAFELDFRTRHGLAPDTKLVLFVGRKLEEKGIAHLLEACQKIAPPHDLALVLVGPMTPWFREWLPKYAHGHAKLRVIDLGEVPERDKAQLLRMADVLALPSRFEAFGIVFLEAWASGTPVIGSSAGAVPAVLGDGGLTVPFGDTSALAEALDRVLSNRGLSRRLVSAGQQRIRSRYRWDRVAERVVSGIAARTRQQLRILYVSNLFPPFFVGGAEIIAWRHARALKARGHDVRVFAGRIDPYLSRYSMRRERRNGLPVQRVFLHPADINAHERNYDRPEIGLLIREAVRNWRPDVVHAHNLAGLGLQTVECCRELGVPVVMTLHDYWGICFKNTMVKNDGSICRRNGSDCRSCVSHVGSDVRVPIEQRNDEVLRALDHVCQFIAPSDYLARRYQDCRFDEQKIGVLTYGIDLDRSHSRPRPRRRECVIGYTGYIGRHKGIHVLLEAIAGVKGARLVLRGPCEDPDGYREQIRDLSLEERVELRRPVPNHRVASMLQKIDVAVLPSVWPDNHPVSILEAMAAGIPVVASRLGGIPELVRDGETGFLVQSGNAAELAERIQQLVDDAPLRETMGIRAREIAVAEYDVVHTIDALETIYREAMAFPLGRASEAQT